MATVLNDIETGAPAPAFALDGNTGRVNLADYTGKQNVVLFFMREFNCAVCRGHAAHLARIYSALQADNTTVLVIGGGETAKAASLAQTYKLPFPVLADLDRAVYASFGLDKALGMIQRSATVIVDKGGIVRYIDRATLPTGAFNEKELLAAVKGLR